MPEARSRREKLTRLRANSPGAGAAEPDRSRAPTPAFATALVGCLAQQPLQLVALDAIDVFAIFQQHAQGVLHRGRIQADAIERDQGIDPVDGLGNAGRLEEIQRSNALHRLDHLTRQGL
jgi:hypothetical protein